MKSTLKSAYDSFAPYYDLVMGDRLNEGKLIKDLIKMHSPKAQTLLELGCGSGSLTKVLNRSYSCVGIDLSSKMVGVARSKVPGVRFISGDITKFKLNEQFDVIICAFDTMNHILSFSKWNEVFKRVHKHLSPSGIFIFDINTHHKLQRFVSEPAFAELTPGVVSIVDAVKIGPKTFRIDVKAFKHRKGNNYELHSIAVPEVTFPTENIKKSLAKYFRKVHLFDPDRQKPSSRTEELYFICKSPLAKISRSKFLNR